MVLIYILKVFRKKSPSILSRKNMSSLLLTFFSWKAYTISSFERFLCWKSSFTTFLWKFSSEIYLSRSINYWGSIFTLCLTWGAFNLVCVLSVFFFFLSFFFFFFYRYFPWQTLTIHRIAGKVEGIIIFYGFHFHPLTNIDLVHRDFYQFFLIDLFIITRLIADETCSP